LTKRYGLTGDGAVLVRPDGYVAWIGQATEADAVDVLRTAVSRSLGGSLRAVDRLASVA
jgi:putative polyketide hydroxylase